MVISTLTCCLCINLLWIYKGGVTTWSGLYRFSKAEIENAMSFSTHKVSLGAGSAGRVYKGVLPSGQLVAIKHIYKSSKADTFTREVDGLSRIRHPNLVCLFGCCVEDGEQYLVYEYCPYGNLAQHLLSKSLHFHINWHSIGSYSPQHFWL